MLFSSASKAAYGFCLASSFPMGQHLHFKKPLVNKTLPQLSFLLTTICGRLTDVPLDVAYVLHTPQLLDQLAELLWKPAS